METLRSLVFSKLHTEDVAAAILAQLDHDLSEVPPQCRGQNILWNCKKYSVKQLGLSKNSVPLNPMVLLIIIPIKWL